jgi:hypothetical protein
MFRRKNVIVFTGNPWKLVGVQFLKVVWRGFGRVGVCAFLTPIGHQNNVLIMGPGGYRFGDYWRMGLPLEVIVMAVGLPLLLWAWPL